MMKVVAASAETKMERFPIAPAQFLTNLFALLRTAGHERIIKLLASSTTQIGVHNYGNWNGGTYNWGLVFRVDMESFGRLSEA
ncbi:MAG TPA: hypothetical protein VFZ09_37605 [Archangium sp.]|uniref:hypothetical protein n=1 Tax=Archangium sp. TaxID=1872627 RepID=UPI002E2EB840|nr:hypothetical protein [Archangium sp.]HEX5751997.1 hypothetical protein [Archangium sp.]